MGIIFIAGLSSLKEICLIEAIPKISFIALSVNMNVNSLAPHISSERTILGFHDKSKSARAYHVRSA